MKLQGIKVIDLSMFLPGPLMTQFMADHGAEVIKIETVHEGEPNRGIGARRDDDDLVSDLYRQLTSHLDTKDQLVPPGRGKAAVGQLVQGGEGLRQQRRRAREDVDDAGGEPDPAGAAGDHAEHGDHVGAERLGHPDRVVAAVLGEAGIGDRVAAVHGPAVGVDVGQAHGGLPQSSGRSRPDDSSSLSLPRSTLPVEFDGMASTKK